MTFGSSYPGQPPQPQEPAESSPWARPDAGAAANPPVRQPDGASVHIPRQSDGAPVATDSLAGAKWMSHDTHTRIPDVRQPAPPQPRQPYGPPPAYGYPPPAGFPTPQPPQRSRRGRNILLCLVLAAIVSIVATVSIVIAAQPNTAPLTQPEVELSPSPKDGDPPEVREEYLRQQIDLALIENAQALLDQDEAGWLEVFDESLRDDMARRYSSLQALNVSAFEYRVLSGPIDREEGFVEFRLAANYCLGDGDFSTCQASSIIFDTEWSDTAPDFTITRVDESTEVGPRPWEVEDLEARVGERAIVAAPAKYADRLDEALEVAEAAAVNADEWAVFEPVDKYLVYLAGAEEFQRWYGINDPMENVVGFAIPVPVVDENNAQQRGGSEVVMHVDRIRDSVEFTSTMRHELGHVATLHHAKGTSQQDEEWWLAEGSAELIDHGLETPIGDYLRKRDVDEYIGNGDWDGGFNPPTATDDGLAGSAKYGIAFYGAYYLATEYGKDEFLEFLGKVARDGQDADSASQEVYGKPYAELETELAGFVEQVAG